MPRLNALKLKSLTAAGRYGDGDGLWLQVRDAEHRSWLFRYAIQGKARQMGLGAFPEVGLAEAREAASAARVLLRKGLDPIEQRRAAQEEVRRNRQGSTFRQVADQYISAHKAGWRNAKHLYQWNATLDLACRTIGSRPVRDVDTADVMSVLEPIWRAKPETASRLRGRIESVLDYAAARGWRTGENPARWRGHLAKLLPSPRKIGKSEHFAALPLNDIAAFMIELRDLEGISARALEFTILTAARSGETLGATWDEIDLPGAAWRIPKERMKAGAEHRVPLSKAALSVLEAMLPLCHSGRGHLFPGLKPGKPLGNMAMMMQLRRMKRGNLTVHGFRSTFRDWCSEMTNYPREVAEVALAHTISDKVEGAYRRGDVFEKRRRLMADWAGFCARPMKSGEVVPIQARG